MNEVERRGREEVNHSMRERERERESTVKVKVKVKVATSSQQTVQK